MFGIFFGHTCYADELVLEYLEDLHWKDSIIEKHGLVISRITKAFQMGSKKSTQQGLIKYLLEINSLMELW